MPQATSPAERRSGRIGDCFSRLKAEHRLALIAYLTVGYPHLDQTPELVEAAAASGADAIELGIPFSDPLADGPTIQAASQAALKEGVTVRAALRAARAARARVEVPLLFMTYLNPILAFGLDRFCGEAQQAGVDGLIVPDLPPSEAGALRAAAAAAGLGLVFFVAPTSTDEGIKTACAAATAFVYCIAVTGVTGARGQLDASVVPLVRKLRSFTSLPIVVGFGISKREHLELLQREADGVIVASALLDAIGKAPDDAASQVRRFLTAFRPAP